MTLRIACSALGKRIFAGHLTKDGTRFREPRHDVTSDVLKAVIDKIEIGNEAEVSDGESIVARIAVLPPIAAPVSETAGEAVEYDPPKHDGFYMHEDGTRLCWMQDGALSFWVPYQTVPAQDDDKLRIAVEEALADVEYVPGDHPIVPVKHDRFVKAIRSALTAAQEGGEG